MKKQYLLPCLAVLLTAVACQQPEVQIADFDTFQVTSVKSSDLIVAGNLNPEIRTMDIGDEPDSKVASIGTAALVKAILGNMNSTRVTQIVGTFSGHDLDGSPLTQSGKVILPESGPIHNMLIVSHFTIGANFECPSESFPLEAILASKGYAVVIADYIGFGVTRDRVHPYMHVESTVGSVVDMALAVKPFLEHIGRTPESEQVVLLGYSQGGSTTLGVMKMLQRYYSDELPIKKVYAGGGPYDLAATFDVSILEDLTGIPCAVPMIVQGINEGEHLGLDINQFFKPELQGKIQEWVNSKAYTVTEINQLIHAKAVSDIMSDAGRDKKSTDTARLYKALMQNNTLDFTPNAPVYIFHSMEDRTVPFVNATKAEEYFKGNDVVYDFGPYGSHSAGGIKFVLNAYKDL